MVFSSTTFLFLFLPALLVAYFCRKGIRWRNGVLLVFSLIFYSFGKKNAASATHLGSLEQSGVRLDRISVGLI